MNFLPSLGEVLVAIDQFLIEHARELEAAAKTALLDAAGKVSPVDKIVGVGEVLYAVRADLTAEGLTLGGQAIEFATRNAWHGLANDSRGSRMVDAMRRQLGEEHPTSGEWPAPETDPEAMVLGNQPTAMPYAPASA